ncbi:MULTISPECIES: LysR family transcriptional regulator [unclassified Agarivorans]|uniref:LysR family transcriptional regulator n=1 Tax=unclassified Agarivorans TaxID=2636026 RepID=UPI0026E28316|nr:MULTISPECIES: LysR family transcriptional regulator [unclassified Agarivorans]MDO6684460.1 LysR family transcriptional regulator [Agarivorans sp. 3_MG-2023]MDO6714625.1 LysR family transcriptional regulator [Agarivorans sp. 2_MG-2023]
MAASLEQLQAFVATVESKGFAQAARQLGKHVSTIREQVNNLEIDTGLELFIRQPRSLATTAKGEQLYTFALAMLKESAHFDAKVDSLLQGIPDELTIAIDHALMGVELDNTIAKIVQAYPYLNLKVLNGDTMQVTHWLQQKQADVGVLFSTLQEIDTLAIRRAFSFGVNRIAPKQWQLPLDTMNDQALMDKLQLSLAFLDEIGLRDADVMSHRYMLCNSAVQLLNLVKAGVGWGHLPSYVCKEALERNEVVLYQEDEQPISEWYADVIWAKQSVIHPAMKLFIDEVKQINNR